MTLPKHVAPKRRLQILDDETRDGNRCDAHKHTDASAPQDSWVNNFVARLAALIRSAGNKR